MFKLCIFFAVVVATLAAPAPAPGVHTLLAAPAVAALPAPIVTASSSQVIARNYNTLAAAPLAYAAPVAAAPLAYSTHAVAPAYAAYAAAPVYL